MLIVDGQPVAADDLLENPAVQAAAEAFLRQPDAVLPCGQKTIYVCQGEVATCQADDAAWLSSSDATTCVCMVLIAAAGPGASAAAPALARVVHHDEGTALGPTLAGLSSGQHAHVWLVGAYQDSKGTGARVAARLLSFLERSPTQLNVRLACLGSLNTAADGSPRATCMAVHLRSMQVLSAAPEPPPRRGPLLSARMAQWAYSVGSHKRTHSVEDSSNSSDGGDGSEAGSRLRSVYCAASRQLQLTLLQGRLPMHVAMYVGFLAGLPDEELLQRWSTSPLHEPPHFVADSRAAFEWLMNQRGPVLKQQHVFAWHSDGWRPVEAEGEADVAAAAAGAEGPAAG